MHLKLERGEVLSKADKNLMKHAFDAGAYTMLQAVSTAYRTQATIPRHAPFPARRVLA